MKKTKGVTALSSLLSSTSPSSPTSTPKILTQIPYPVLREISALKALAVRDVPFVSTLKAVKFVGGDLYRWYDYVR